MAWAPDYVTAAELKAYMRIDDTVDDVQIALAVTAASRAVDQHCDRQFGQLDLPEARTFTADYDARGYTYSVQIDDLATSVGLVVETTAVVTDYTLNPVNAPAKGKPWTSLVLGEYGVTTAGGVTITARWGWPAVPAAVKLATLLQAARFYQRREAPFGVAGSLDLGSEMRLLAKVDPDVTVALAPYARNWWVA